MRRQTYHGILFVDFLNSHRAMSSPILRITGLKFPVFVVSYTNFWLSKYGTNSMTCTILWTAPCSNVVIISWMLEAYWVLFSLSLQIWSFIWNFSNCSMMLRRCCQIIFKLIWRREMCVNRFRHNRIFSLISVSIFFCKLYLNTTTFVIHILVFIIYLLDPKNERTSSP